MFNWYKKRRQPTGTPLTVDMHSHLLPGLDDGVKSVEESLQIVRTFTELGYKKIITTPHVMSDIYRNTSESIQEKAEEVRTALKSEDIDIEFQTAAEYYLDEQLLKSVYEDQPLLTLAQNYLLFETNFLTEPLILKEFIFQATSRGYKLVMAHPERYLYLHQETVKVEDLLNRGVLFQININSITGYYSKPAQRMAYRMIDRGWVHFLGSDCHHKGHIELLFTALKNKYYQKALTLPLLNNTLS